MIVVINEIEIAAPLSTVFDAIADLRHQPDWNPLVTSVVLITSEPVGSGSHFEVVRKGSGLSQTYIGDFERPTRISYKAGFRGGEYEYTAALSPSGSGSQLEERVEMVLRGPMILMSPIVRARLSRELRQTALRVKARVEANATHS